MLALLGVLGCVGAAIALTLFHSFGGGLDAPDELMQAQTIVFNFVVLYEVILIFVIRQGYKVPFWANKLDLGCCAALGFSASLSHVHPAGGSLQDHPAWPL